jgi:adenine C2-methylase RlmN of 23S rRNA A2503 and tRNA A37
MAGSSVTPRARSTYSQAGFAHALKRMTSGDGDSLLAIGHHAARSSTRRGLLVTVSAVDDESGTEIAVNENPSQRVVRTASLRSSR